MCNAHIYRVRISTTIEIDVYFGVLELKVGCHFKWIGFVKCVTHWINALSTFCYRNNPDYGLFAQICDAHIFTAVLVHQTLWFICEHNNPEQLRVIVNSSFYFDAVGLIALLKNTLTIELWLALFSCWNSTFCKFFFLNCRFQTDFIRIRQLNENANSIWVHNFVK